MMNVLIVYGRNENEILNRKSALGSYIFSLSKALQEDLNVKVYLNGKAFSELEKSVSTVDMNVVASKGIKAIIKKLAPRFVKQRLYERQLFGNHQLLLSKLKDCPQKFDRIVEFYTLGSKVGMELSHQWNVPLDIVYDSPVIEQEEFFKNTRVAHPKRITKNEKATLERSENIIVYSNPVKVFLSQKYNLETTSFLINQNVDFSRLDFIEVKEDQNEIVNICFLGSFLKWHRVDLLIKVFEELSEQYPDIELHLIGTGMEHEAIKQLADSSTATQKIALPGFLDGEQLAGYKSRMHIGLMPGSNWYGAPNKIFEYGAAGMAVVTCKTPTICDMFSENEVVFFEQNDEAQLKDALTKLITNKEVMVAKAKALQDFIKSHHKRENTINTYQKIFNVETVK